MAHKIFKTLSLTLLFFVHIEAEGGFLPEWCAPLLGRLTTFIKVGPKSRKPALPLHTREQQLAASYYVSQRTPPDMQWDEDGGQSLNHSTGEKKNAGHVISKMAFHRKSQRNKLDIEYYRVDPKDTGDDLGTLLIARAISTAKQDFSLIYGQLTFTNAIAYENALAQGASRLEAVKSTPFYKSCAKLGFGRIVEFEPLARGLVLGPTN